MSKGPNLVTAAKTHQWVEFLGVETVQICASSLNQQQN